MKSFCTIIASLGLLAVATTGIDTAQAMPVAPSAGAPATIAPHPEKARIVCTYRRCYRVGGYRYVYRPYGYYRPYYYRPHIGIGLGGVGIGIY